MCGVHLRGRAARYSARNNKIMTKARATRRGIYLFLLILGAVFWIMSLSGLRAQTIPAAGEAGTSQAGTSRGTSAGSMAPELATSTAAVSALATSTQPRPRVTGSTSIPSSVPLPVEPEPVETPSATLPPVPIQAPIPEEWDSGNTMILAAVAALVAAAVAYGASRLMRKGNKDKKDKKEENQKCEDIKTLLEQKSKEFEDMVRKWPKEKLQEMAKEKVLTELKKDEGTKKILDTVESANEKYDKLKEAIEMLQKKYDLCTSELSLGKLTKAVIFDLNGVFIKGPKLTERFRDNFNVPEREALDALKEVMSKVRLPDAGDVYEYWMPYFKKWNINLSRADFLNYWFSAELAVPDMESLARELKSKGVKIFILSNNFSERTSYYKKNFPFLEQVSDKIYYSWQTGFLKINPEAYKLVLKDNGLKPEECAFFDDSEENIKVAWDLGIKAFLFESAERTRKLLE